MGGMLVRPVDDMADLAQARPVWMNGDPKAFSEVQMRDYQEYQAKEKAAIEERIKRKVHMKRQSMGGRTAHTLTLHVRSGGSK